MWSNKRIKELEKDKNIKQIRKANNEEYWKTTMLEIAEIFRTKREMKKLRKRPLEDFDLILIETVDNKTHLKMFLDEEEIIEEFSIE